jgi:ketosteroid isomerase-like protein
MMTTAIPDVIERYLGAAPEGDLDTLVACFTSDAEVIDEERTFVGHDAIRGWREDVASAFTYTMSVLSSEAVGADRRIVTADLAGDFPGSPAQLTFRFTLRDGLISALHIAP